MTKQERQQRHQARLEQKALCEREWHQEQAPKNELIRQTTLLATSQLEKLHQMPDLANPDWIQSHLRLWHYPSFAPFKSRFLYSQRDINSSYLLYEVAWDREKDVDTIYKLTASELTQAIPKPSIQTQVVEIPREEINRSLAELRRLSFPVFVESRLFGIDGDTFGIETGNFPLNTQLSWWGDGPPEWKQAIDWYHQINTLFTDQLQAN